jgi:hypothetical protein
MEDIQAHPETLGTATAQRIEDQQTPPPVISVDEKITAVFTNISSSTDCLRIAMLAFFPAFEQVSGYEVPAQTILDLMSYAKNSLLAFFPGGLPEDQAIRLPWAIMMVLFWNDFRPHGYIVKEYPDDRIRTFFKDYRSIAHYLGVGNAFLDLIVTPPPPKHPAEVEPAPVHDPASACPPTPFTNSPRAAHIFV